MADRDLDRVQAVQQVVREHHVDPRELDGGGRRAGRLLARPLLQLVPVRPGVDRGEQQQRGQLGGRLAAELGQHPPAQREPAPERRVGPASTDVPSCTRLVTAATCASVISGSVQLTR
jgi:hypothetical protein